MKPPEPVLTADVPLRGRYEPAQVESMKAASDVYAGIA